MPSVSKKQQKFMGIVRAIQKGDQPAGKFSKDARDAAKKMKKKDVKKFAKTKHDGLPTKVRQEIEEYVDGIIDGIGEQFMVNEEQCMCEACQKGYMTHPTRKTKEMFGKRYRNCIKKESTKAYSDTLNKIANDKKMKMISKKDKDTLVKLAKLMKSANESYDFKKAHKKFKETGELPPHLKKMAQELDKMEKKYKIKNIVVPGLEWMSKIGESIDEGKYSKIMKAVRKGPKSGPWQIIVSKNNKVVKEVPVKTLQLIPAHYDDIKKAYPNHKIGIEAKDGKIVYREWVVSIKEGSCGYGIDGNLGEEPAGPHLLKKKKKKKDEVSLGGRMAKKIGKHGGTRDKGEIAKILKLLIKRGNKKKDAMDMINKNYDRVSKAYRKASPAKKAEILSSLQESVNEGGMELKKLEDAIKMFQKKIKKQGRVTNARDEDHLENLIKIYKQMGGKKIKEAVKLRGKSKGTISHVGMPPASKGVEKLFKIADTGFGKVGGQTVDSMSANLFKQIYNKANDDIKKKLNTKSEKQLIRILAGMWDKFGKNVKIGSSL